MVKAEKQSDKEMIIDAEDLPMGRLAAFVAKQALLGHKITIANCEKAIITGGKREVIAKFRQKRIRGTPEYGPFYPRKPEMIARRIVRGMVPRKKGRGRDAFARVHCVQGPLQGMQTVQVFKGPLRRHITLGELSRLI